MSDRSLRQPQRQLLDRLGYSFRDPTLLDLALAHRSVGKKNNERLEFIGDSLLNTFIAVELFQRFPETKEGQLSRLRAQLVKGETLAAIAREFDLGEFLILGEGEMKSGGKRRDSILADALEAIIGAIYLDSDFETCRICILSWFSSRLEALKSTTIAKDSKTLLQEWLQGRGLSLPSYEMVKVEGQAHAQIFTVACVVDGLGDSAVEQGRSRREAEKKAAKKTLEDLQKRIDQKP